MASTTSITQAEEEGTHYISQRGLQHGQKPLLRYIPALIKASHDLYHPIDNPDGIIIATLSENTQMADALMARLEQRPLLSFDKLLLGDHNGSPELRNGIRQMMMREISSNIELRDDHILCLAGATSVMAASACALFNPGDALLILTPCYPAFIYDFTVPGDVHTVLVPLKHPAYEIDLQALDEAYHHSISHGHTPRAVLVTNPSNPTGLCHSKHALTSLLRFVRAKKLFYISSEVYGTTYYPPHPSNSVSDTSDAPDVEQCQPFVSIIDIAHAEAQRDQQDVHHPAIASPCPSTPVDLSRVLGNDIQIIWSASKDLGLSGFRVGASICQNPLVHSAMSAYGIPSQISREAQYTVALWLNDCAWSGDFFKTMRSRLHHGCSLVEAVLERLRIPFVKPSAGLNLWFDLAEFLPLYYYKRSQKATTPFASDRLSPNSVSTGPSSPTEMLPCSQEQPTDDELDGAEWEMFEEIFFSYKLGLAPGTDFHPAKRSISVSSKFLAAAGFPTMSSRWLTSAGHYRLSFGAVPLPFMTTALERLETFVNDKRDDMHRVMESESEREKKL